MDNLVQEVQKRIGETFGSQVKLSFYDERDDGKHFSLKIVSNLFEGKGRVERSQMVYKVLEDLLKTNTIHALRMECKAPNE